MPKILQTLTILLLLSLATTVLAQREAPKTEEIAGHTIYYVLEPGAIPPVMEPEFISVAEAGEFYYADEPLIAVVDDDSAKGYSTWHLDRHEIVNDYINGKAITVTW